MFFLETTNIVDASYPETINFIPVKQVNDLLKWITTSCIIQFVFPKTDFDLYKFILSFKTTTRTARIDIILKFRTIETGTVVRILSHKFFLAKEVNCCYYCILLVEKCKADVIDKWVWYCNKYKTKPSVGYNPFSQYIN